MTEPEGLTLEPRPMGGILAFYAAIWSAYRDAAARWHLVLVVEVAMVLAWFVIRTVAGVDGRAYAAWLLITCILSLLAPTSGLVVFIATSVFYEPGTASRALAPREFVLSFVAVGVLARVALDRFRWRPAPAVWVALLIALGTGLTVLISFSKFDRSFAWFAAHSWYGHILGAVVLLAAAAWSAKADARRLLVVPIGVAVVGALVSMAEHASPGLVSAGPFGWVGFWKDYGERLAGTIPSPNAQAAQFSIPTAVLLAALLLSRDLRLRLVAFAGLVPLLLANYLTFSRSPLLAGYAFAVIVAWRIRKWAGIAVLVAGVAASVVLVPRYLAYRAEVVGGSESLQGSILTAADQNRILTWGTAIQMWRDAPLTGQGFLAYKALAPDFGDDFFGSPHNEWLRLFAESGVIVGLLGLAWVAMTARSLSRIPGWLGTGLLAGFVGFVIAASFNNPFLFIRVSAVAFPMIGVGLAIAERARAPTTEEPVATDGPEEASGPATSDEPAATEPDAAVAPDAPEATPV